MQEQQWLWLDRQGWCFPGSEVGGSFVGALQPETLTDLLAAVIDGPTAVVLSPRLSFSFHLEHEAETTAMEAAQHRYGMQPGAWTFHEEVTPAARRVTALHPAWTAAFERWQWQLPGLLMLCLSPLQLPETEAGNRRWRLDDGGFQIEWDGQGFVTATLLSAEPERLGKPFLTTVEAWPQWRWSTYVGAAERTWRRLTAAQKSLTRLLTAMILPAMIAWGLLFYYEHQSAAQLAATRAFLAEHQREGDAVLRIQESGTRHWEKLRAKQVFSRHSAPLANDTARMANLAQGRPLRWQSLVWRGKNFSLVVAGANMSDLLDYADSLRALPELEQVVVEELQSQTRLGRGPGDLNIRLEGRLR